MVTRTSTGPRELVVLRQPTLSEIRNGLPTSFLNSLKIEKALRAVGRHLAVEERAA